MVSASTARRGGRQARRRGLSPRSAMRCIHTWHAARRSRPPHCRPPRAPRLGARRVASSTARAGAASDRSSTRAECRALSRCTATATRFRSTVDMARHRFGRGEYRYFAHPLPPLVAALRTAALRAAGAGRQPLGGRARSRRRISRRRSAAYLARCHAAGQTRPTPLLLRYRAGDYNCLHQDLYGDLAFPLQVVIPLSDAGPRLRRRRADLRRAAAAQPVARHGGRRRRRRGASPSPTASGPAQRHARRLPRADAARPEHGDARRALRAGDHLSRRKSDQAVAGARRRSALRVARCPAAPYDVNARCRNGASAPVRRPERRLLVTARDDMAASAMPPPPSARSSSPARAGSAPACRTRSRSSTWCSSGTGRRCTCGTRSSTTGTWSTSCARRARSSSTSCADVPAGSLVIFSAHGVAPSVREEAAQRQLRVVDATCPLGHQGAPRGAALRARGLRDPGHRPPRPRRGGRHARARARPHAPGRDGRRRRARAGARSGARGGGDADDAVGRRHARHRRGDPRAASRRVRLPAKDDICYATQNRQTAVKELARQSDLVLVIGSPTSSNANRLVEVARNAGGRARLIEHARRHRSGLARRRARGRPHRRRVDAGVARAGRRSRACASLGFARVRDLTTADEHVTFPLPRELRGRARRAAGVDARRQPSRRGATRPAPDDAFVNRRRRAGTPGVTTRRCAYSASTGRSFEQPHHLRPGERRADHHVGGAELLAEQERLAAEAAGDAPRPPRRTSCVPPRRRAAERCASGSWTVFMNTCSSGGSSVAMV